VIDDDVKLGIKALNDQLVMAQGYRTCSWLPILEIPSHP